MEKIVKRIQNGEEYLLSDFIKDNMRYVYAITKKYEGVFEDYEDLIQEGIKAFLKAIYNFNTSKRYFVQYLNLKILAEVNNYVYYNLDRIIDKNKRIAFVKYLYKKCENRVEFEPDIEALTSYYGILISKSQEILNTYNYGDIYCTLDEFSDFDEDYSLETILDIVESDLLFEKLNSVKMLTDNEKEYLKLKYVDDLENDVVIAKHLGVSKQLICNRSKHLNKKLRLMLKDRNN